MRIVNNESPIFFDVDDTLVMWHRAGQSLPEDAIAVKCPYDDSTIYLSVHKPHVKLLKNRAQRGSYITVWSANGYQWAETIVRALGLESYVDCVMSKPRAFVDDLSAAEVLGERIYLQPDSVWGNNASDS